MRQGFDVRGAEQLVTVARKLRAAGDRDLRREMLRGMRAAVKPSGQEAKANAMQRLPHRGGLAQLVASSRISTRIKLTGNPRVQVVARNESAIRNADAGKIRHPVWGSDHWVTQRVTPGWWSDAMRKNDRRTAREMSAVLDRIHRQLGR
jgi:hypothetical protein